MVLSFNRNIHSTSTQSFFVQQKYSFNFNTNFFIRNKYSFNFNTKRFRSTELFIPAGCKLYSTQQRTKKFIIQSCPIYVPIFSQHFLIYMYALFIRGSRGGLMVSALGSGSGGPGSSLGQVAALCFRQDTLLSQCLSPPRCINGYQQNVGGNP